LTNSGVNPAIIILDQDMAKEFVLKKYESFRKFCPFKGRKDYFA